MRMRFLKLVPALLLLQAGLQAQDTGGDLGHDALGFPITFNDEIITRTDALRALGNIRPETVGNPKQVRDDVILRKLRERAAALAGIVVTKQDINDEIKRQVDKLGGDAAYYQWLEQNGLTVEGHRHELATLLLVQRLNGEYLRHGFTRDRKLLPFELAPTPQQVRTAYEHDRERWVGKSRVLAHELRIELSRKENSDLARRAAQKEDPFEWAVKERQRIVKERLDRVLGALASGKSFDEAAAAAGKEVRKAEGWVNMAAQDEDSPQGKFLSKAKAGEYSEPIRSGGDGYRLLYVEKRETGVTRGLDDLEVWQWYAGSNRSLGVIRDLRGQKAFAWILLDALDRTTIEPKRVRTETRKKLAAELAGAEERLRALGLH